MSLDKIKTEYRKEFYNTYHRDIKPILSRFETKRKEYLKIFYILEALALIGVVTAIIFTMNNFTNNLYFIFIILSLIAAIIIPIYFNNSYIKELKKYCMNSVLKTFGKVHWANNMISNSELNESELFATFNRRSNDDGFTGEYKGVEFEIAETNLSYESGSGKRRTCVQVFKGVVIKFTSNKDIKAKTIIATKGDKNIKRKSFFTLVISLVPIGFNLAELSIRNDGGLIFSLIILAILLIVLISSFFKKDKNRLNLIKLEDPVFAKKFNAYSADEVEGRYLITTAFMERFINLNTAFGANKAKCSFYGDNIMFAISTNRNLFEIGNLFKQVDNPEQLTRFFEEFSSILLLVDYFKLHEHTKL